MADNAAQLTWEKRAAPWAAGAAVAAVLLQVAGFAVGVSANKDAPARGDPLPIQQSLVNFHNHSGPLLTSALILALANFFTAGVLYYLFRATRHRRPALPPLIQWLLVIGPVLLIIGSITYWTGTKDAADKFAKPAAVAQVKAKTTKSQHDDAVEFCKKHKGGGDCVPRLTRREAVAKKLSDDNRGGLSVATSVAGPLAIAFAFVVIALNAMRAGLLSRFMGVLGIIVGALIVLPLLPSPVVQIFWLGAMAILFLGRWPGGRGPAWETGEAEPWPVPEGRGGLFAPRSAPEPEPEPQPEPEPVNRPASRKRRSKKRR
jgi:hypothetical protein